MAADVLRLQAVTVVRDGAVLLDRIDWRVQEGERWVILGPNGAGKTTLLQVAAALVAPTSGRAELLGEDVADVPAEDLRTRIGLASPAFAETLPGSESVLDVVLTAAYAVVGRAGERYDPQDEARARGLLTQFGCRVLIDRAYGTLSEGERKRVQIARALMTDPELLLLDEPAAGLDLGAREALLRRLSWLAADPDAPVSVLVSHHVEEIPTGMTHALLIRGGRVMAAGPVTRTLIAPLLSACFGIPLDVTRQNGRYAARMAPAGPPPRGTIMVV